MNEPNLAAAQPRAAVRASGMNAAPLVLVGGLVTTGLALFGVYEASQHGENLMGWYADYVIPVGALVVGLVASSGYGLASYTSGTKVTGRLLAIVLALLAASYFVAQYVEFKLLFPQGAVRDDGSPVGFWAYFDIATRAIYWKGEHAGDQDGAPLGALGYGLRALELVGFVGGGAIIPFALRKLPYCAACRSYKKTKRIAFFAAGVPAKRVSKKKVEENAAYQSAHAGAYAAAEVTMKALLGAAQRNDAAGLAAEVAKLPRLGNFAAQKLTARIGVDLVHCPRCQDGELRAAMFTGQGKQVKRTPLAAAPMDRGAVGDFLKARGRA